jgi:hypothetical protein
VRDIFADRANGIYFHWVDVTLNEAMRLLRRFPFLPAKITETFVNFVRACSGKHTFI